MVANIMESPLGLIFLFMFLLSIVSTIFWIWALVDCAQNERSDGNEKLIWMLVIVFGHGIGALIYYFVRRPQRMQGG